MPSKIWVRYRMELDGGPSFGILLDNDSDADFLGRCLGDVARLSFVAYYGQVFYIERQEGRI